MTVEKIMHLHAATNTSGSECTTSMDISESDWLAMSDEHRDSLIREFMGDILDVWVTAEKEGEL